MEPVALQDYICSLNPASLPRVLKICSGVYFQSSIYELCGSECCLSTGDLIKIIQIKLKKVICENTKTGHITELSPDFPGYFSSTISPQFYGTLNTLLSAAPQNRALPVYFSSVYDIKVEGRAVPRNQPLVLTAVKMDKGVHYAHCTMDSRSHKTTPSLPLSLQGTFYSWGPVFPQTLLQTLQDPVLLDQPLVCPALHWDPLILQPEYEIDAIMNMRRNIVKIPSTLEVDVEDVTGSSEHLLQHFIKPLLLSEVMAQGGPFPMQVKVLEVPDGPPVFHRSLKKGQTLVVHGPASPPWRVLASSRGRKTSRHFFISGAYKGKLRRRPREFHTAFDLLGGLKPGFPLHVVVTQDWEGEAGDSTSPSLCRGDRMEVLGKDQGPRGDVLVCNRLNDLAEEEEEEEGEEREQLLLPLYFSCGFVEEMSDSKRYSLASLITQISLPCEVKVLGKDPSLAEDPLPSFLGLQLEEKITEPFLTISLSTDPRKCFEIPPRWLDLTVVEVSEPLAEQGEPLLISTVEELTEAFYYKLRTLQDCGAQAPPPRPPKNKQKSSSSAKPNQLPEPEKKASKKLPENPIKNSRTWSLPQSSKSHSNLYSVKPKFCQVPKPLMKSSEQRESADDSDHDYENPEEEFVRNKETLDPYPDHGYEYVEEFRSRRPFR
ncbi:protein THEMIS2 [Sarcophilus harrisii]|uniref:Thymocyte selection associated family member 2 n=1 Tax=Sarcophilus harrisii TaxID=9305 RepID=G3WQW9_SARHA|nr:protein THEMIS2 [Sarcophilus harrisii]